MVSITVRDLTKKFGDVTALDQISLEINAGELFFLLGPSGCGKTTLLRHIAGFYTPHSGKIFFGEDDVTTLPAHKRNTAMMFQSYALWPHMNVAKNVAFGLEEQKVAKDEIEERVGEALETVQMRPYAERKINELSGGQQQRVALARALVVRPRCLLLDEPLSNLDAKLRLEMRGEIRRIVDEFGLTAIYVTHDRAEALSIADRMAILEAGKIAQIGTPVEIYRNPITSSVASFIGETNLIKGILKRQTSNPDFYEIDTDAGLFKGRLGDPQWNPTSGQTVTLSIRPESFALSVATGSDNTIKGNLKEAIYLGEIAQYELASTWGASIRVAELNPRGIFVREDEEVGACAAPEDVIILRR